MASNSHSNENGGVSPASSTVAQSVTQELTMEEAERGKSEDEKDGVDKGWMKRAAELFHRYRKYTVVLGGIFVYLPIGVPWYFGKCVVCSV